MIEQWFPGIAFTQNIHPLLVHFPIAIWLTAWLFWGLGLVRSNDRLHEVGLWLLALGTLGGVLALGSGYLAADGLGHDSPGHDLVHNHRDYMVTTTILAVLTMAVAFSLRRLSKKRWRALVFGLLTATIVVLGLGADRGGELVFRYGVGVRRESPPVSSPHQHGGHSGGDHH